MMSLLGAVASPHAADLDGTSRTIPFDQLGIEARKQGIGQGAVVTPTATGAQLSAVMQDLEGEVTRDGLWITSLAEEDAGRVNRFRVRAAQVCRSSPSAISPLSSLADHPLLRQPPNGTVQVAHGSAAFLRPGLIEEYTVSTEGIRQDFVVLDRPAGGTGALTVSLEVTGTHAEAASYGARLTVNATGRELAYSRLKVTDATGRELTARMQVEAPDRLRIEVDDLTAAYPVRIDPTFSDENWLGMGGFAGVSSTVNALAVDSANNLYAGGGFSAFGNQVCSNVIMWNGSAWSFMNGGLQETVVAIAVLGTNVYAAEEIHGPDGTYSGQVRKWDGTAWSTVGGEMDHRINVLAVMGGELYAGGRFSDNLVKWNGTAWIDVGGGPGVEARALAADGDSLYVGGVFSGGGGSSYITRWTGTAWSGMGSGVNDPVNAVAVSGSDVYVAGEFSTAGGNSANRIAKWNGTTWSALG